MNPSRPALRLWLPAFLAGTLLALPAAGFAVERTDLADISYGDPAHKTFFNYQRYLLNNNLAGLTPAAWVKLDLPAKKAKIFEGEALLSKRLEELLAPPAPPAAGLTDRESKMLQEVWGKEMAGNLARIEAAREMRDPAQLEHALKETADLAQKTSAASLDWQTVFDNSPTTRAKDAEVPTGVKNATKPEEKKGFLDSLESREVKDALATDKRFVKFLQDNKVPDSAVNGLYNLKKIIDASAGEEKKNLEHILPTVILLLKDGKPIKVEDEKGALGFAVSGDYDEPAAMAVTPAAASKDPVMVALVLGHEFQHIYDMYTGRYYTLDSEIRAFKLEAMLLKTLKKTQPERYAQLLKSRDASTREMMIDEDSFTRQYDKDLDAFVRTVGYGHSYIKWNSGVLSARWSVKESLDAENGEVHFLGQKKRNLRQAQAEAQEIQQRLETLQKNTGKVPFQELDEEIQMASEDLAKAQASVAHGQKEVTISQLRINRLKREYQWMTKRDKDAGHDLNLTVDREYLKQ